MGFFSSAPKKRDSHNSDLTVLDPPDLSSLVDIPNTNDDYKLTSGKNNQTFMSKASQVTNPSPTESNFSVKSNGSLHFITSSGLKGEQERNLILEQQVKILSHQAAMALDQLNEMTKENDYLKKQNYELTDMNRVNHNNNRRHANNTSISSSRSSHASSIFSGSKDSMLSKGTSMNSISSYTDSSINELKQNYETEIKNLHTEIQKLQNQLNNNDSLIDEYKQQHWRLTEEMNLLKSKNSSIFNKLISSNKKQKLQMECYQSELQQVLQQLETARKRDHDLRKRLMEHNDFRTTRV